MWQYRHQSLQQGVHCVAPFCPCPQGPQVAVGPAVRVCRRRLIGNSGGLGRLGQPGPGRAWVLAGQLDGVVKAFGGAGRFGSLKTTGGGPVVGIAPTPDAGGYWLATAHGRVYGFGDAKVYGSMATAHLAKAIVGITRAPGGRGYWLFGGDGGVFSVWRRWLLWLGRGQPPGRGRGGHGRGPGGTGLFAGHEQRGRPALRGRALGPAKVAAPLGSAVAAMAATPDAKGYWLVTTKGKVVPFGDAHDYGSMTGALKADIVGIAPTANGKGYWLAARDGAVFGFGDAKPVTHQAVAGPQARPVSAIALSFNTANPRAKTAHASSTDAAAAGGNCTNPSFSTSDAEGTENIDGGAEYWWVNNDAWSGSHGPQSISVCNHSSWYAVSDQTRQRRPGRDLSRYRVRRGWAQRGYDQDDRSVQLDHVHLLRGLPLGRLVGRRLRPVDQQLV